MRGIITVCAMATALASEDVQPFSAACSVSLFSDVSCGQAVGTYELGDEDGAQKTFKTPDAYNALSYSVDGTGCGDVEIWDDEEAGSCDGDNEWWGWGSGCQQIASWDVQADVSGITIFKTSLSGERGQTARCASAL